MPGGIFQKLALRLFFSKPEPQNGTGVCNKNTGGEVFDTKNSQKYRLNRNGFQKIQTETDFRIPASDGGDDERGQKALADFRKQMLAHREVEGRVRSIICPVLRA